MPPNHRNAIPMNGYHCCLQYRTMAMTMDGVMLNKWSEWDDVPVQKPEKELKA